MFCIKIQNNKDLSDSEANTKSFGLGLVRPPSVPFLFRTSGQESHTQAGLARVSVKQIERYEHTFLYCRWSRLLVFGFLCGSSLSRNIVKQCANILALFITFCKITKNHALHFHSLEDVIFVQFNSVQLVFRTWLLHRCWERNIENWLQRWSQISDGFQKGTLHVLYFLLEDALWHTRQLNTKAILSSPSIISSIIHSPSSSRSSCAGPFGGWPRASSSPPRPSLPRPPPAQGDLGTGWSSCWWPTHGGRSAQESENISEFRARSNTIPSQNPHDVN